MTLNPEKFVSLTEGYTVKKNINGELVFCDCATGLVFVSNGDGTHNTTCSCGSATFDTNLACSGGVATCTAKAVCETCGEEYGEVDSDAHDIVVDEAVAPKCGETGLTAGQHCSRCDAMTIIQEVVPALTHKDDDGDSLCDHGCGTQISSGGNGGTGEAETPDGSGQPEEDGTICEYCRSNHNNPITRIFCRITQFFIKLFTFLGFWE
ncbi:MAG: hypothetical protein IJ289_02570 [Clostridia bacterium]|nr:hypothetical protein [Clostridia bacterium]